MKAVPDAILFIMKKCLAISVMLLLLLFSVFPEEILFEKVRVSESEILSEEEILGIVGECTEKYSGMELLNAIVSRINELYREKGYPNAIAYVPEQTIEDGTVLIELIEGRAGTVTVSGSRYTTDRFILRSLDIDMENVLNLSELERKLLAFNRWNTGIDLTCTLNPGKDKPGTTDIDVLVTESHPTGAYATVDNYATEATGGYRAGIHFVSNSLSHNRDSLLAGAYANLYSQSFYTDYNFPFFGKLAFEETRLGVRGSYSRSKAGKGSASLFDIRSNSFSGSAYMNTVVNRTPDRNISVLLNASYSQTSTKAMDTQLSTESVVSGRLGVSSSFIIRNLYLSASAGFTAGKPLQSANSTDFYWKFDASVYARLALADVGFISISASGQLMPFNDLVPNQELMYAGGSNSVRGYSEGCAWGKSGYTANAELHFMLPGSTRSSIFAFADHAGVFPYPDTGDNYLFSIGAGLDIYIGNIFHVKAAVGCPLIEIYQDSRSEGYRFCLSATFSTPNVNY